MDALRGLYPISPKDLLLSLPPCRRSTRWWARWSWWKWTRTAWRPSRGWTGSSPRWIRTTTTRSHWRSSKRRPRATRPSYYCCSVTSRNRPEGERSAPPVAKDCTERISCSIQFAAISTEKKKYICLDYLSMDLLLVFETLVCMRMLFAIKRSTHKHTTVCGWKSAGAHSHHKHAHSTHTHAHTHTHTFHYIWTPRTNNIYRYINMNIYI